MFGNSKEYQELKKLYEEKVSKPEKLDEFVGLGKPTETKVETKPTETKSNVQTNREKLNKSRQTQNKDRFNKQVSGVTGAIKSFADRFKARPIERKEGQTSVRQKSNVKIKSNTGTDNNKMTEKDLSDIKKEAGLQKALANKKNLQKIETKAGADKKEVDFKLRNTESSEQSAKAEARPKRRPVPSPMEAGMGPGAARAREMARRRIAAKKAAMEEYTPYDIVLEYLLSTEQAATIEEANYVMTEMDAETIQGIVEEQKKNFDEGAPLIPLLAKGAAVVGGALLAKKGLDKAKKGVDNYLNKQRNESPFGGNKRVEDTRKSSGDNKVGEKIYYGN